MLLLPFSPSPLFSFHVPSPLLLLLLLLLLVQAPLASWSFPSPYCSPGQADCPSQATDSCAGVQDYAPLPRAQGHPRAGARLGTLSASSAQGGWNTLTHYGRVSREVRMNVGNSVFCPVGSARPPPRPKRGATMTTTTSTRWARTPAPPSMWKRSHL